jgi:hypothetical protein
MNVAYDEDENDESLDDSELPDVSDVEEFDESETVPCPQCGKLVYESADLCPSCGSFIIPDAPSRKPLWIVLVVVLLIGSMLLWALWLAVFERK